LPRLRRPPFPAHPKGRLQTYAAQLWALRGRIEPGDLLIMPLKTTRQIAMGRVTGGYRYRDDRQVCHPRRGKAGIDDAGVLAGSFQDHLVT
jgi:predicted Mrr-cat superfamily restriction endonuclease